MATTTETVTTEQIAALKREAADAGDDRMVDLCERAIWTHDESMRRLPRPTLSDDAEAITACVEAIRNAEAQ